MPKVLEVIQHTVSGDFIESISNWLKGCGGLLKDGVELITGLFWSAESGLTFIGNLALYGAAIGLLGYIIYLVYHMVRK